MARTSKTVVQKGANTDKLTAARARATQDSARRQASEEARGEASSARMERGIQQTAQAFQQQASQKKEQDFRAGEAGKDRSFRSDQAQMQRDFSADQQAGQTASREGIAREQMDLQAAGQGLERDPEFARREQAMKEELDRGERQMMAPGELDGSRFVPTEQSKKAAAGQVKLEQFKADTSRMSAKSRAQTALMKGSDESYKLEKDNYAASLKKTASRADGIMKAAMGDPKAVSQSANTLSFVKSLAANNPDPELQAEIESGQLGSAAKRFLDGKVLYDSLDFVSIKGDWPDPELINEAHPKYQEFQGYVVNARDYMRRQQQNGAVPTSIRSTADANRYTRRIAAITMREMEKRKRQQAALGVQSGSVGPVNVAPAGAQPPPAGGMNVQQPGAANVGAGAPGVTPVQRPAGPQLGAPPATLGQ